MTFRPFSISVPKSDLDELATALARTRFVSDDGFTAWDDGTPPAYVRELIEYWRDEFDWAGQQEQLNSFSHYRGELDGTSLHFIHEKGKGPNPLPLLLVHGYPDSFYRFHKLIPLLTDPAAHGGDPSDAFDVVVPSLPGYGWSDVRTKGGGIFGFGDLFAKLMAELGYEKYGAHGGDWGGTVVELLARSHARHVVGIHMTDVPFWHAFQAPDDPTAVEKKFIETNQAFQQTDGAYAMIQGTRPMTPANALNDSPAGLAAWIVERFYEWSDVKGDLESRYTKDELLTNVMIYWVTQTIGSAFLPYRDFMKADPVRWTKEAAKGALGSHDTPAAFALFPADINAPPREWAERFFNVQRWTEMKSGGHFAAMEEPEKLADDIRTFFRDYR